MGKRHQASRRRAYGRRQHEVRERSERPGRDRLRLAGIQIHDAPSFDDLDLSRLRAGGPVMAGRSILRFPLD